MAAASSADQAAEHILAEVAQAFPGRETLTVTVSIGIATVANDLAEAVDLADRALYAAKAAGRARACRAEPVAA